jgi:hypothetical protein
MKNKNIVGMWIAIGIVIGTVIGIGIKNIGIGLGTGMLIGSTIGLITSKRSKNDNSSITK